MLCLCANEDLLMPGELSLLPCRTDYNKVTRQHIFTYIPYPEKKMFKK